MTNHGAAHCAAGVCLKRYITLNIYYGSFSPYIYDFFELLKGLYPWNAQLVGLAEPQFGSGQLEYTVTLRRVFLVKQIRLCGKYAEWGLTRKYKESNQLM